MHLPHAVLQCPSCYIYCMSRSTPSAGGPPIPPHGNNTGTQHGHQEASEGSPQRTQPRAVTLPHVYQCSHQDEMEGPQPRFGSLPHQQQSSKSNMPNHDMLLHHHPPFRATTLSHNIVGLPEECPPPLPPHGPPALPPAHLISKNTNQADLRGLSPLTKSSVAQNEAHYNFPGRMPTPVRLNDTTQLQASYPPPSQMMQSPLYGSSSLHTSITHSHPCGDLPSRCPNPQNSYQVASGQDRNIISCGSQHSHGSKCHTIASSQHAKESHPHVPHPRSYPQGGSYPSHSNDTYPNSQSLSLSQHSHNNPHTNSQSGLQSNKVNNSHTHPQSSQNDPPTSVPCQHLPAGLRHQHPPHSVGASNTLSHVQGNSHYHQQGCAHPYPQGGCYPQSLRQYAPHSQIHSQSNSQSGLISSSQNVSKQLSGSLSQGSTYSNTKSSSQPYSHISAQQHLENRPQPHLMSKSLSHPLSSSEPHLQSTLQPQPQNSSQLQPQSGSQLQPQSGSQMQLQSGSHMQPQSGSQLQAQSGSQLQAQSGSQLQAQSGSQLQAQSGSQLQPQSGSQLQPQSGSQLQSQSGSQLQPQSGSQMQILSSSQQHPQSSSQTHSHSSLQSHSLQHPIGSLQSFPKNSLQPQPQNSSQPHLHCDSQSNSHSSSRPQSQSDSQSHPQNGLQPHPQNGLQPHPQNSSHPLPQSSSHPLPQSSSQPHPQSGSQPYSPSGSHPHPQNDSQPHLLSSSQPHLQSSSQPHPQRSLQTQSHNSSQLQAKCGSHTHSGLQGSSHIQLLCKPDLHNVSLCHSSPQGSNQFQKHSQIDSHTLPLPHGNSGSVSHSQISTVPSHIQGNSKSQLPLQCGSHPIPQTQDGLQGISRPQLHPQNDMQSTNNLQLHFQKDHHLNPSDHVSHASHSANVADHSNVLVPAPKAGILKKTGSGPLSVGNCSSKKCSHNEQDSCYTAKQFIKNHPHPPRCMMMHNAEHFNAPHVQHLTNDLHHHQCPSCPPKAVEHKGTYGVPILRTNNVPPPPPMPPPPNIPLSMPFGPFQYDCLPHQLLVPPPLQQEIVLGCPEHGHHHFSSAAKVDRPYCGPGPPGRNRGACVSLNKNHGLDAGARLIPNHHHGPITNGNHHHLGRRHQVVSQSAVMGSSRHGTRGVAVDDCSSRDRWRRNGGQREGQSYELSQDLADKRLEMLERRYGGDRARRAATTIQRAYRHYAMHKKFRAITATAKAQEKRLSRRFTVDASNDWADSTNGNGHPFDAEQRIRSEFDKLNRNLNATVYGENRRPSRSLSMRDSPRGATSPRIEVENLNDTSLYCHSSHNTTTTTTTSPSSTPIVNGSDNHHSQHFSGDSNSYASSRELKYLTSEDSGFGSQEPVTNKNTSSRRSKSAGRGSGKKVPPEVPRRTSSIKSESSGSAESFMAYHHRVHCAPPSLTPPSSHSSHSSEGGSDRGALRRSADNGSLSSVQSSGSDSSLSQSNSDRGTPLSNQEQQEVQEFVAPTSPVWKRKSQISEVLRKRQYRVGLNLFNKKPERGINYLIGRGFLENSSQAVAKFLLTRKGLSKQMIGEYLGNLQNQFNMSVLESFATEIDLSGVQVDVALRKFQTLFRMPGEAQKIERLMQVFAQRYCQCNRDIVSKLHDPETIFVLAFAIIMLNTDLHTASLKPEKRMKLEDFVKNLRGIDDGFDIEREMLEGMYQRIKDQEFRPGNDHVTQVLKVQQTVVGKKPVLALPHRRLVCYCRLYEIPDPNKKERSGLHQREVFLFNDLLVVTKIFSKKKNSITYTFRESFPLAGLQIQAKETLHYPYLLEVRQRVDNKVLIMLNARNEHDRTKFCEDLRESILEMDEMENLRIEGELERQKANLRASRPNSTAENRDSGVADMELITPGDKSCSLKPEGSLKRTTLSNSLLDIHEAGL